MASLVRNPSLLLLASLFFCSISIAADRNGYTNPYECKAGGTWCSIDVDTYAGCACDTTFNDTDTKATIENALNGANDCFCFNAGDYSALADVLVTANGAAGAYRVMRLSGTGTGNPATLAVGAQAQMMTLEIQGTHWLVHRLTWDGEILSLDGADGSIVNNILHNDAQYRQEGDCDNCGVQNSVLRETDPPPGNDIHCAKFRPGTDQFFLNNEAYNCSDMLQLQDLGDSADQFPGFVIVNNDLYVTTAYNCDSDGTPNVNGFYSRAEDYLDFKGGASQANPGLISHNRMWGLKKNDASCGSSGGDTAAFNIQEPQIGDITRYMEITNNIVHGARNGVTFDEVDVSQVSIIGNFFHRTIMEDNLDVRVFRMQSADNVEIYLNTIIDPVIGTANKLWIRHGGNGHDIRCNVFIDAGTTAGTPGGTVQIDRNVYYGTDDGGDANKIDKTLVVRANSTAYALNQAMVKSLDSSNCGGAADSDCFMYIATVAGTSAAGAPNYCTSPNCTFTDGTVTWQAFRGPLVYYRFPNEIFSPAELAYVPYGRVYSSAPEYLACPAGFAARNGVGIDDTEPP